MENGGMKILSIKVKLDYSETLRDPNSLLSNYLDDINQFFKSNSQVWEDTLKQIVLEEAPKLFNKYFEKDCGSFTLNNIIQRYGCWEILADIVINNYDKTLQNVISNIPTILIDSLIQVITRMFIVKSFQILKKKLSNTNKKKKELIITISNNEIIIKTSNDKITISDIPENNFFHVKVELYDINQ